jgi:hypothetical protein
LNVPNSVGRILEFPEFFFRYGFNSKIIREDGTHISFFSVDHSAIEKLIENDFWVLRDRNL